jgi:hypothetical protein
MNQRISRNGPISSIRPLNLAYLLEAESLAGMYSARKQKLDSIDAHISVCILGGGGVGKKTFISYCRSISIKEEITSSGRLMFDVLYPSAQPCQGDPKAVRTSKKYRLHIDDKVNNNAHVYLVLFDLTSFTSIVEAKLKIEEIKQSRRPSLEDLVWNQFQKFPCILVGNKLDYSRYLSDVLDHAKDMMDKEHVSDYQLISAKTGENMAELFEKIVQVRTNAEDLLENLLPSLLPSPDKEGGKGKDGCKLS